MRRLKILLILLAVLIAASITVVIISRHEQKKEEIKNSDAIILEIPKESVTALSFEYEETKLSFSRGSEGTFLWDEDAAFPADQEKIDNLLSVFESFGVSFVIENVEDFAQYGLTDPEAKIRISTASGTTDVLLGAFSTIDEKRYVSIGDGKVYLVNHDPMDDYKLQISDLIKHDEIPKTGLSGSEKIRFSGAENYEISLERDSGKSANPDDLYFADTLPLSTNFVTTFLSNVRSLSLSDYVSYNATAEELAAYGLDNPDLTITLDYPVTDEEDNTTMETLVLHLGQNQEDLAEAQKALEEAEQNAKEPSEDSEEGEEESDPMSQVRCYARVGDSQIIYEISNTSYQTLTAVSLNELRQWEVLGARFQDITGLTVTVDGETYSLTTETTPAVDEDSDPVRTWYYDGEKIESTDALSAALTALSASNAESFTDAQPDGKEEIALTVSLDNENFPTIDAVLYRADGKTCLAVKNGKTLCYVPRSTVVDLIEAVNEIVLK